MQLGHEACCVIVWRSCVARPVLSRLRLPHCLPLALRRWLIALRERV
jgi:hypothetical protein